VGFSYLVLLVTVIVQMVFIQTSSLKTVTPAIILVKPVTDQDLSNVILVHLHYTYTSTSAFLHALLDTMKIILIEPVENV